MLLMYGINNLKKKKYINLYVYMKFVGLSQDMDED